MSARCAVGRGAVARAGALLLIGLLVGFHPVTAQVRLRSPETRLLRDAANRESQGDFEGAERILLQILEEDAGSSGALFALERVLKAQGETIEMLPSIDRFLEHEPTSSGVRYLKLRVLSDVDSLDGLRREAERWLDSDPSSEVPYREVARVYERAFGQDEALALLRRGARGDRTARCARPRPGRPPRRQRRPGRRRRRVGPSGRP